MKVDILKKRFNDVYFLHVDAVFRYCIFRVSDREVVTDLVQDVFAKYWDALFQGKDIGNDKAFIFTISRNLIIDYYRKKKSLSLDHIIEEIDDSSFVLSSDSDINSEFTAEARMVLDKMKELEPIHREIIHLRYIEGFKPKDIATILNVTSNVVSVRLVRALEKLREVTGINMEKE
jgi:RNA polymerase sigma-70 factor (ECF subfamily)